MTDLSKWFNAIADQVISARPSPPDDLSEKIVRLLEKVKARNREAQARRRIELAIARQRDELLIRIAEMLGIGRDEFPDLFKNID